MEAQPRSPQRGSWLSWFRFSLICLWIRTYGRPIYLCHSWDHIYTMIWLYHWYKNSIWIIHTKTVFGSFKVFVNLAHPLPDSQSSFMRRSFHRSWSLWDPETENPWPLLLSSAPDSFCDLQNEHSATPGKVVVLIAVENWGFCVSLVVWLMMCDAGKAAFRETLRCGGGGSKFKSATKVCWLNREPAGGFG